MTWRPNPLLDPVLGVVRDDSDNRMKTPDCAECGEYEADPGDVICYFCKTKPEVKFTGATSPPAATESHREQGPPGVIGRGDDPPDLALEPNILARFGHAIRAAGVVGEEHIAMTEFLAITSRLLDKPTSLVIKGSSSSGKSFTTEQVCKFFPDKAVLPFTGMSEKALILSSRSFEHRTIIVYEATALRERAEKQSGDQTAYYIRSLVSEGQTHYEMSVRTKDGSWTTKRFEKHGPTNVIVTTTAVNLHNENETRMLSLQTNDSTAQTAAVLLALADGTSATIDYRPWHALQDWLFAQENRVVIPFARYLAENIPPVAVRLRRDFGAVLSLIKAHAVLHQAARARDDEGRIVATSADYQAVRNLVIGVVSQGVGATVSETVRETVAAVATLAAEHPDGVPATAVGRKLGLDPSAGRRRLLAASVPGFIVNHEERPRRPGRFVVGEPLPDDLEILPQLPSDVSVHTPLGGSAIVPSPSSAAPSRHPNPQETAGQSHVGTMAPSTEGVGTDAPSDVLPDRARWSRVPSVPESLSEPLLGKEDAP